MRIDLNKDKHIGRVLFIVEGEKTEKYVLWKVFSEVFGYQLESKLRNHPYRVYNQQKNPFSKVFVINTQESNIPVLFLSVLL